MYDTVHRALIIRTVALHAIYDTVHRALITVNRCTHTAGTYFLARV
jgi:hypothetical protein